MVGDLSGAFDDIARSLARASADNAVQIARLEQEHRRLVAASVDSNADDEHDPEGATIAFEREQLTALLVQARHRAGEWEAARQRLVSGCYGICEECGGAIAPNQLLARPAVRTCIGCAGWTGRPR